MSIILSIIGQKFEHCTIALKISIIGRSLFGGMSTICNIFFKRLASLLADKKDVSYSVVMSWLCCRVSFSLLRSAIDCLRGAQSSKGHPSNLHSLDLAVSEGQLSQ